jgi:hypothetical protein
MSARSSLAGKPAAKPAAKHAAFHAQLAQCTAAAHCWNLRNAQAQAQARTDAPYADFDDAYKAERAPRWTWTNLVKEPPAMECAICTASLDEDAGIPGVFGAKELEVLQELTEQARLTNPNATMMCGHIFHTNCLADYVRRGATTCPICRLPLPNEVVTRLSQVVGPVQGGPITKQQAIARVARNGDDLQNLSNELRNDREVVLAAVTENGLALQHASNQLRDDRQVVLAAVTRNGSVLQYASNQLRDDREVVLAAVTSVGGALLWASDRLKDDKEVVTAAIRTDGSSLFFASDRLKDNKEVVLVAVRETQNAFLHASKRLKNDLDVAQAAGRLEEAKERRRRGLSRWLARKS